MCGPASRGQSDLVGTVLLVGITVVAASSIMIWATSFLGLLGGPTEQTAVTIESTEAGSVLIAEHLSDEVVVRIEGENVTTVGPEDVGDRILLPTAPGEVVTVVAKDDQRSVITAELIHKGNSGDFIGYYTYDSGSGSTLRDHSQNGNDGTLSGNPDWGQDERGHYLSFDGDDDYVTIDDITVDDVDTVDELTVGMTFRFENETGDGNSHIQQLVEHRGPGGEEVFIETTDSDPPFELNYAVEYPGESSQSTGSSLALGETHTAIATFDQSNGTYDLYIDGNHVAGGTHTESIAMGRLRIGRDDESAIQHFDGVIYETRVYYSAFEAEEVERLDDRMD